LYRARAEYYQRSKLVRSAQETLAIVEGRADVDAERRQVLRARAAVTARESEMARSWTSIRNAESRLRLLVNDPILLQSQRREFIPSDAPLMDQLPLSIGESLYTALQHRPDISRSIREVRASAVRLGVARNEVLPKLDLLATTYVAGLTGGTDVSQSFGNQFADGRPTYSVGMLFEFPLGNRAARAQQQRRRWEMNRSMSQFRLTVEEALTAVEVAVREVETTYEELIGRYDAMVAAADEVGYLSDRWRTLPGTEDSAILLLDNLLDAQDRLADEEAAMARAQVGYAMAIVRLKQEMGTLLLLMPAGTPPVPGEPPAIETLPQPEVLPNPPSPTEQGGETGPDPSRHAVNAWLKSIF
jgi:outer membrane protein TolC